MFNLGMWEIVVLGLIALIVVGPERLPKLARNVASFLNEIKRTTNTITKEVNSVLDEEEFLGQSFESKTSVEEESADTHNKVVEEQVMDEGKKRQNLEPNSEDLNLKNSQKKSET